MTKPVFYNEHRIKYLRSYGPQYPSINTFEAKLKSRGLIEFTTTIRFKPNSDSKHYCLSLFAYQVKGVIFLQSYQTIVAAVCLNPYVFPRPTTFRLWDGNSRSTSKHITSALWKLKDIVTLSYRHIPHPRMRGPVADFDALLDLLAAAKDFDPQESEWPYPLA